MEIQKFPASFINFSYCFFIKEKLIKSTKKMLTFILFADIIEYVGYILHIKIIKISIK